MTHSNSLRRSALLLATLATLSTTSSLSALPNSCFTGCGMKYLAAVKSCEPWTQPCQNAAQGLFDDCVDACGALGAYGDATSYQGGAPAMLSAGVTVGGVPQTGQGTVTQASFSLLDLDAIPSDLGCVTFESLPWVPLGLDTFDGNQSWVLQVDTSVHVTSRGFVFRADLEDAGSNSTLLGLGVATRLDPVPSAWTNLAGALPGTTGCPMLVGNGTLAAGSTNGLTLSNAAPTSLCALFLSLSSTPVPFMGGVLQTIPLAANPIFLGTSSNGTLNLPFATPAGLSGLTIYFQYGIMDAGAPVGVSLSNAISGSFP